MGYWIFESLKQTHSPYVSLVECFCNFMKNFLCALCVYVVTWYVLLFQDYVLNEAKCRTIVRQICRGVEFIHNSGIIHLDIKPFNIVFYARNSDYDLRIIDFGLARALMGLQGLKVGMCGTIEYMSPEVSNLY